MQFSSFFVVLALLGFLSTTALGQQPANPHASSYICNPTNLADGNGNSCSGPSAFGDINYGGAGAGCTSDEMCAIQRNYDGDSGNQIAIPAAALSATESRAAVYLFQLEPYTGFELSFGTDGFTCGRPYGTCSYDVF